MAILDFANKTAKTSTEIHCFKTNLGNLVVGPLGSRRKLPEQHHRRRQSSVSSGHRVQNFDSEALSGFVGWIGEECSIERSQRQLRPVLRR